MATNEGTACEGHAAFGADVVAAGAEADGVDGTDDVLLDT